MAACLLALAPVTAPALAQARKAAPAASAARPDPRLAEADRALAQGDVARALELASAAVAARPASARARLLLARAHLEQGDFEKAYVELDRALQADPRNVDVLAYMGLVSGTLASATFQRLATEAPGSARVKQLEAEALTLQERRSDAEAAYEAALAIDPTLIEALLALGKLKRIRLACDEAVALYERAEAVRPTFDAAYGLGFCRAYLQEDAAAVASFELAVKRDPKAAVAWSGLGTALVKTGRAADGIAALQRALAIEPRMSDGWYMLGMAYQSSGDSVRAKDAFAKAEALRGGAKP